MKKLKWWLPVLVGAALVWPLGTAVRAESGDGWLGVYIQNVDEDLAEAEDLGSDEGVLITGVIDDSPADEAGLRRGDIILKFDGRDARSVRRLTHLIDDSEPGAEKTIVIRHKGREKEITVAIGEDKDRDRRFFGNQNDFHFEIPDIDLHIPDGPGGPKVYSFSTGQLSSTHIGVSLYELSDQLADYYGVEGGALVNEVLKDSPAEEAGLKAGDVIVKMDDESVDDISEIREAIQEKDEDDTVEVTVLRDGSDKTFEVGIEESRTWSGVGTLPRFDADPRNTRGPAFFFDDDHNRFHGARRSYDRARGEHRELRESLRNDWRDEMNELREELKELREDLKDLQDEMP